MEQICPLEFKNSKCPNSSTPFKKYKAVKGKSGALKCPHEIQTEIIAHGSVTAGMVVAEDFMHYKGGVYKYDHGDLIGGHAVKIVGWGKDAATKVDFWIVENSWGPEWGENGFFKIKFGENLIDSNSFFALPDLESSKINVNANANENDNIKQELNKLRNLNMGKNLK